MLMGDFLINMLLLMMAGTAVLPSNCKGFAAKLPMFPFFRSTSARSCRAP